MSVPLELSPRRLFAACMPSFKLAWRIHDQADFFLRFLDVMESKAVRFRSNPIRTLLISPILLSFATFLGCPQPAQSPVEGPDTQPTDQAVDSTPVELTEEQEAAVAAIEKMGGKVDRNDRNQVVSVNLINCNATDADLERIAVLTDLTTLRAASPDVKDVGLAHLKPLTNLRILDVGECRVGDEGLAHLSGLA